MLRDSRGDRLVAALQRRGLTAERVTPIDHEPVAFTPPKQTDWVVVTSAVTVPFIADFRPSHSRVAAVGPATAAALQKAGWPVDLIPRRASGLGLVAEMPPGEGRTVWLPRSDLARPDLPAGLEKLGYTVINHVVYRTRILELPGHVRAGLVNGDYAAVVAFSPSGVAALPDIDIPAVAIGLPTATALRAAGITQVVVAESPTDEALERAVLSLLSSDSS